MKIKDCWTYIATMAPPIWGPPFYGHKRVISLSSSSAPDSTAATQQRGQLLLNLGTEMVGEIRGKQHVKPIFAKYLWKILEKMLYIYIHIYMFGNAVPHSQRNFNRKPRLEFPWKIVLNWPCCRRYKFGDLLQLAMSQGSWPKVITAGLNHLSDDKPTRSTTANGKQRVDGQMSSNIITCQQIIETSYWNHQQDVSTFKPPLWILGACITLLNPTRGRPLFFWSSPWLELLGRGRQRPGPVRQRATDFIGFTCV